jgi:hypothetical protein
MMIINYPRYFKVTCSSEISDIKVGYRYETNKLRGVESASELYRLMDRRWLTTLVPSFAD